MPPVLVVLFWVWVFVSVVMLFRRHIIRRGAKDAAADEAAEAAVAAPPMVEPVLATAAVAAPAPTPAAPIADFAQVKHEALIERRTSRRGVPAAGIAEALVGIRMPCDLVPLVVDRLATDRIALSTVGHPAEVVGTGLADELERLGYALKPVSDRDLIATRGATALLLSIERPNIDGRHLDHPEAREDAVVVEIALH